MPSPEEPIAKPAELARPAPTMLPAASSMDLLEDLETTKPLAILKMVSASMNSLATETQEPQLPTPAEESTPLLDLVPIAKPTEHALTVLLLTINPLVELWMVSKFLAKSTVTLELEFALIPAQPTLNALEL